jgi:hypothetical protein
LSVSRGDFEALKAQVEAATGSGCQARNREKLD